MSNNTILGKEESVILKHDFMYSIVYFFIKSEFILTNKRIICNVPNLFLFIPSGKNNVTYPLNNIAGVRLDTKVSVKSLLIGIIITLIGLSSLRSLFLLFLIGALIILSSFETIMVIQNNSGSSMAYPVSPFEKGKAQDFINQVNTTIADRV